jgi:hypothetical protein
MTHTIDYQGYQLLKKKLSYQQTKLPPFAEVMAQVAKFSQFQ